MSGRFKETNFKYLAVGAVYQANYTDGTLVKITSVDNDIFVGNNGRKYTKTGKCSSRLNPLLDFADTMQDLVRCVTN